MREEENSKKERDQNQKCSSFTFLEGGEGGGRVPAAALLMIIEGLLIIASLSQRMEKLHLCASLCYFRMMN